MKVSHSKEAEVSRARRGRAVALRRLQLLDFALGAGGQSSATVVAITEL